MRLHQLRLATLQRWYQSLCLAAKPPSLILFTSEMKAHFLEGLPWVQLVSMVHLVPVRETDKKWFCFVFSQEARGVEGGVYRKGGFYLYFGQQICAILLHWEDNPPYGPRRKCPNSI